MPRRWGLQIFEPPHALVELPGLWLRKQSTPAMQCTVRSTWEAGDPHHGLPRCPTQANLPALRTKSTLSSCHRSSLDLNCKTQTALLPRSWCGFSWASRKNRRASAFRSELHLAIASAHPTTRFRPNGRYWTVAFLPRSILRAIRGVSMPLPLFFQQ